MHANVPHFSPSAPGADADLSPGDLGPLAWVMEELRKSLEAASTALRRPVREGWTAARGRSSVTGTAASTTGRSLQRRCPCSAWAAASADMAGMLR
jgi:hypothetical protein